MRIALVLCFTLVAVPVAAQRLPGGAAPEHYTLRFVPDLTKATFRATADIRIRLAKPASAITLHAAELTFDEVSVEANGTRTIARVTADIATETITITLPAPLPAGAATIHARYTGILNDKLRGFYLSRANGRAYAVSQMEATDARRAFPSFDEPAYKATFDISMTIPAGDVAISNGAVVSDTPGPDPGTHTVTFATTPKMSTYLVALLVGDFACREGASDSTAIRICATPDKKDLTGFALTAAEHQVKFFNEYFGIKYPFGKLDIIGIPDFAAGAMENAGAITFRERLLLVDEATASIGTRKAVASVLAHEIAHQWFGNLVTMKWWDDIWLNEGFATWAANKPLAAWKPEWQMDRNAAEETQRALALDSLHSTRAIRTKVETPDEINEVFDPIAYEKTSGVINMIEAFVGPEAFRKGVSSYLTRYASSNAAGEDFWNEVTRVTEKPVNRVMRSYVDQAGAPILSVRTACVSGKTRVALRQGRFEDAEARPAASGTGRAAQVWSLPVCLKSAGGTITCDVMTQASQTFEAPGCGAVFVNADARGYYLTEYEPSAVAALATRSPALTAAERISLLGDEWRLVRTGRHGVGTFLDLAAAFARDVTPEVMAEIATRVTTVATDIADTEERTAFAIWVRRTFGPALDALGREPRASDPDDVQSVRGTLLRLLGGVANDAAVQSQARTLAMAYLSEPTRVPPTLVAPVLQVAAAGGDAALYDQYLARMRGSSATPDEYYRFFNALPSFRDPALVKRTLQLALSDEVRSQDTGTLLAGVLAGPEGNAAWTFVTANWDALSRKLGTFQGIPGIVASLGAFCTAERSRDIAAFFAAHPVPAAARALQQAEERIGGCVALDARQSKAFAAWLEQRSELPQRP